MLDSGLFCLILEWGEGEDFLEPVPTDCTAYILIITNSPIGGAEAVHIPYRVSLFQPLHIPLAIFEYHSEKAWGFELTACLWMTLGHRLRKLTQDLGESVFSQGEEHCLKMKPFRFQTSVIICPLVTLFLQHACIEHSPYAHPDSWSGSTQRWITYSLCCLEGHTNLL